MNSLKKQNKNLISLQELLGIIKLLGISYSSLANELGVSRTVITQWKNKRHKPSLKKLDKLVIILRCRGKFLSRISLENVSLKYINQEFGVSYSILAKDLNISTQYIQQISHYKFKPKSARELEIQEQIRGLGRNILKIMEYRITDI
jgi:ribosome-binding protein aMBF1 (putative translation factor)